MTSLLDGAARLGSRGGDLDERVEALGRAVAAARGRLDASAVDDARSVVDRVRQRLGLAAEHTVVAIAGATGSGKSSTFNAIAGVELSSVGVRRPTTSWATACVWGRKGAGELLDHLGIAPRHQIMRESLLDLGTEDEAMQGVVLLDLPDHDSTEVSHHVEVDRLVELADLMVWVLDPQKYADAAIHHRYLAPLATHRDVMLVVLNHVDEVPDGRRTSMLDDVRRLLDADGLEGVPLLATSARTGEGVDALRTAIAERVRTKQVTRARLEGDVRRAADRLREAGGVSGEARLAPERVAALDSAFARAAGVPAVVESVEASVRARVRRAAAWPVASGLSRLRRDPLERLRAGGVEEAASPAGSPAPTVPAVERAGVDAEVRAMADDVAAPLSRPWGEAVQRASVSRLAELDDRLDAALSATDLDVERVPAWARLLRVVQWLLLLAALAGLVWIGASLGLHGVHRPRVAGVSLPVALLVGGVALGVLLGLLARPLASAAARSRAGEAEARLAAAISATSADLVVAPVRAELAAFEAVREGLARALCPTA